MPISVVMQAPVGSGVGGTVGPCASGAFYAPNALGEVAVAPRDVTDLLAAGYVASPSGLALGVAMNIDTRSGGFTLNADDIIGGIMTVVVLTASSGAIQFPKLVDVIAALSRSDGTGCLTWWLRIFTAGGGSGFFITNDGWILKPAGQDPGLIDWSGQANLDFILTIQSASVGLISWIGGTGGSPD